MLSKFFKFQELNTNFKTEITAGVTTFMTMAYIIFVQPAVLSVAGMDFGSVMMATCLASAIATILMGLLANYPIALAPAMGHNFFFVYTICLTMGISWQKALGANFISGALFIILSLVAFREKLITAIPNALKDGIAMGIGFLIAFIGFEWSGIVVANPGTFVGLGDLTSKPVIVSLFGILAISLLISRGVKGAILWGMALTGIVGMLTGIIKFQGVLSAPPSLKPTLFQLDISGVFDIGLLTVVFVLFFLDLFDTVGTLIGVGQQGGFMRHGKLPRANKAFLADAIGTVEGTLLGTTTVTSYIESASGIAAGGKTGFASIVTGVLFLCSMFFFPLVKMIGGGFHSESGITLYPITAPALIIVGSMMMVNVIRINWKDYTESIPAFLTIMIMPVTFSITEGISFGFISYSLLKLFSGRGKEVSKLVYIFSLLFIIRYAFLR
jgi:AGZA family xanthine/uracil permease-like MFS transporter